MLVQAAEVAKALTQVKGLTEKTKHLVAVHKLPKECFPVDNWSTHR